MDDDELIERFEKATLTGSTFHHREHVRVAWIYLHRYSPVEALARMSDGLRALARRHGAEHRYHETITWAYFFLIRERLDRCAEECTWDRFAEENADLLDWNSGLLSLYYHRATLGSDRARRIFVMPDRVPGE
ncbi:MAG TPA: hypothetical protein VHI13_14290 [Candidatus Kapabacteria bacterium]|nr:hypothetical protein [Candidatus Kapabacteria bacterium]